MRLLLPLNTMREVYQATVEHLAQLLLINNPKDDDLIKELQDYVISYEELITEAEQELERNKDNPAMEGST